MPSTLSITLDATQFEAAVSEVDAAAKKMGKSISSAGADAKNSLSRVSPAAASTAAGIRSAGSAAASAGGQISKGGAAVSAMSGALGAASPKLALFGQAIQALVAGPFALLAASISAIIAIASAMWDDATESAEEYAAKCDRAAEAAQKETEQTKEQADATSALLQKLQDLNAAESAGNAERQMTANTLAVLERKYGDLGAKIDATTGKVVNFNEVSQRVRSAAAAEQAQAMDNQAAAIEAQAKALYVKTVGDRWFTTAKEAEIQWANTAAAERAVYLEICAKNTKDEDEIEAFGKAADLMRQADELKAKASSLRSTGFETEEEKTKATLAAQDVAAARRASAGQAAGTLAEQVYEDRYSSSLNDGTGETAAAMARDSVEYLEAQRAKLDRSSLSAARELIAAKESGDALKLANAEAAFATISRQLNELDLQIYEAKKKLSAAERKKADYAKEQQLAEDAPWARGSDDVYAYYMSTGNYAAAKETRENQVRPLTERRDQLATDEEAAEKKLRQAQDVYNLRDAAAAEKEIVRIREERLAVEEKIYNFEKQINAAAEAAQKRAENLQKSLRDSTLAIAQKVSETAGLGKEFAEKQALLKAAEMKGTALTKEESAQVKKISALSWDMNHRAPALGDLRIKTNALTARGGFAGGAVKPDTDKVTKEIARYARTQASLLAEISNALQKTQGQQTLSEVQKIVDLLND